MLQTIELLVAETIWAVMGAAVSMVANGDGKKLEVRDDFVS